jgi:uncharacterized protein YcbX
MNPCVLSAIFVYPVKALDGIPQDSCTVLASGALEHDRSYAIIDREGNFVNGKREPAVHRLRATFDLKAGTIDVSSENASPTRFHLDQQAAEWEAWLAQFLGYPVRVVRNTEFGFPDDTESPGPTVVTTATLETVARWFPDVNLGEARRRFRANLEIAAEGPFWEDRLVGRPGEIVLFQIGDVSFFGTNPCQRCVVPTRSSRTGDATIGFPKTLAENRRLHLPEGSAVAHFDHFYRLAVNTRLASLGSGQLRIGDEVRIVSA